MADSLDGGAFQQQRPHRQQQQLTAPSWAVSSPSRATLHDAGAGPPAASPSEGHREEVAP